MSFIADPFVVLIDACAMVPVRARDVMLTFDRHGLFRARLTCDILDEWERALVGRIGIAKQNVAEQRRLIEDAFDANLVTGYGPLIAGLTLPDPKDRHVLAAAIKCSAQHIITHNHRDFPSDVLEEFDISTLTPDEFLSDTFELYPTQALAALRGIRMKFKNPAMNPGAFLLDMTAQGLPRLAARVRDGIEFL